MSKSVVACLFITLVVLMYSCTHKPGVVPAAPKHDTTANNSNNSNPDTSKATADTSVCFERDILPIFLGSCAMSGCHNTISAKKGYILTSYATIMASGVVPYHSSSTRIYTECVSGKMPKSPIAKLDSTQLSLIQRWIDMGAPDDTNCVAVCDTTKFTYAAAIAPILKNNCYSCHASAAAPGSGGGIVLDNYNSLLIQVQNGKLMGDLQHLTGYNFMPLGGNKLEDCQITQVSKWISAGAQNN